MSVILRKIVDSYHYVERDLSDQRTHDYLEMRPYFIILICFFYYKFVKDWGPKMMKNREPFKIENVMKIYNIVQILSCGFVFYKSIEIVWWSRYYSFLCQPLSWEVTPIELNILFYVRCYYYLKLLDLLDTVFFVLRKKQNHVSFLHFYHHMLMAISGYLSVKYIPGGHAAMVGTVNCFIHAIMYTYYLLTIINPEYKKSIWWKKHLTQLQIIQFLFLFIHFTHPLFQASCTYPKWVSMAFLPQNAFMIFMFGDFYYKEYVKKKQ